MALIRYRDISFRPDTMERIVQMNAILSQYKGRVSVRQLYYRFVAAGHIDNNDKEYSKIQDVATRGRYAGLIDWNAIEDRNREAVKAAEWENGKEAISQVVGSFRLPRWRGQPFYIELWVEKAALAGVLAPIAADFHITMMVQRGYGSASAMKESADRIRRHSMVGNHPRPVVMYLGDHDPSGEDMVRDIRSRLTEFGCPEWIDVRKLALTMAQVDEYKPPPNPAKLSDSRASGYIEKHGSYSWEVDALPPDHLDQLVRRSITPYIDKAKMDEVMAREREIRVRMRTAALQFQ